MTKEEVVVCWLLSVGLSIVEVEFQVGAAGTQDEEVTGTSEDCAAL